MSSSSFLVEATRGALAESIHPVSVAVVDRDGRMVASAGDPERVTWWRSAAKPFQALPLLEDGVADRHGLTTEDLALACASHSSEPAHLEAVDRFMARAGVAESELACGIHPPISAEVARAVTAAGTVMTPRWSNCSGKHTGMVALARHHGWEVAGYQEASHPLQQRIIEGISRWTGVAPNDIATAPDGCTAACFALPLQAMALGYARYVSSDAAEPRRILAAMMGHPFLVAGTGRLCTDLMTAWPGRVVAKVGAEGVYSAGLPELGLGLSLKVEDGHAPSAPIALMEVLRQLLERVAPIADYPFDALEPHRHLDIVNTREAVTGRLRPAGELRFLDG